DRALDGIEAVAHLAALMSWHPKDNTRLFEVNVTGTFNLLQATRNHNLKRFVYASSGEVYPELNPKYLPIDEHHPTLPTSTYGMTKLLGEQLVSNIAQQTAMSYCVLRFSHTQSADELFDPNSFFSGPRFYLNAKIRQLEGGPQGPVVVKTLDALRVVSTEKEQHYIGYNPDGKAYRMGMCDTRDMCQGVELGLTHEKADCETFNIGAVHSFDFDEAVPYLARMTGLPIQKVTLYTTSYRYDTSIQKAVDVLGYSPQYDIFRMIDDVVAKRH
ncbi:MAG: NAD-dependent epimerase/dehydratase family protein, partial [Chloroflexi bacterium]|nr:NAD-dependent epimerase/dehydratase family protein [Chloroflexota bacterium]